MRRVFYFFFLLLFVFSALCFAQQNAGFTVIGKMPDAGGNGIYQIQVGAFQHFQHAEMAFGRLYYASLYPVYESYESLTRVVINGVAARDVPSYLYHIQQLGFNEVIIRELIVQAPVYPAVRKPPAIEIFIDPVNIPAKKEPPAPAAPAVEETPAPAVPAQPAVSAQPSVSVQETSPVRETAPRPQQPQPQQPLPLLPAPGNRYPEDGYILGEEHLRQQRSIDFSWDAVEGATSYTLSIYQVTPQGRAQIFITEPLEQTSYTLDNLEIFENNGTYVWRVEAGNNRQRGQPGENGFTLNVPYTGRVNVKDTGILYGN